MSSVLSIVCVCLVAHWRGVAAPVRAGHGLEVVYRLKSRAVEQLLEGLFCKEKNYHDMG